MMIKLTDELIEEFHPVKSGRHDAYKEALRLVGKRTTKAELVALICVLLICREGPLVKSRLGILLSGNIPVAKFPTSYHRKKGCS